MMLRGGLTESAQIQTNTESLVFVAGPMPRSDLVSCLHKIQRKMFPQFVISATFLGLLSLSNFKFPT